MTDCDDPLQLQPKRLTYTVDEAGVMLGVSRNTAYALAKRGDIPTIRMGRRLLVPKAAFDKLFAPKE